MSHFHCYVISHFGIYQNLAIPLLCINFIVVNNPLISLAYNNKHLFHALDIVNSISFGSFLCVFFIPRHRIKQQTLSRTCLFVEEIKAIALKETHESNTCLLCP